VRLAEVFDNLLRSGNVVSADATTTNEEEAREVQRLLSHRDIKGEALA
jgi:hypothetical protein